MEEVTSLFHFFIGGFRVDITLPIIEQWAVMILIMILVSVFVRNLQTVPRGAQVWVEMIVGTIRGLVKDVMGIEYDGFISYVGTIIIFLLMLNLFGLTGLKPPTTEFSVTLGLGLTSFLVIQGTALRKNGLRHYIKGIEGPMPAMIPIMFPLNLIERITLPISLGLRLFGNMFAASIMMELLYQGLTYISGFIPIKIPILAMVLPIPFHMYFDMFDGAIQMFIFVMLTMVNIKITVEE